ncbi:MFS transporter [Staphylococcus debuckii]|uniref:MFS transporter n=1 Tax=Staphylococcus debuckii TaxID=2044912 RepID=A0ABU9EYG6_9STAP
MEQKFNYNLITTVFFITGIAVMCSLYSAIPLMPVIGKELHLSESATTLIGVVFSISYSVSCMFYGIISDKFGKKKVILIGLCGLTLTTLAIGFIHNFILLLVVRVLQGMAAASFSPVSLTYVTEVFPIKKRVTAISFISTSFMLSGVIGQNLSDIIAAHMSWRIVYFILTVVYILLAIWILRTIPKSPYHTPDTKFSVFFKNMRHIFDNKGIVLCFFVSLTILTSFVSMYTILNEFLTSKAIHADLTMISTIKLFGLIGMVLALLAGRASDFIGVKKVLLIALLTSGISIILMGLTHNIVLITTFSVTFIAGIAFAVPSVISQIGLLTDKDKGFYLSINTFMLFIGTAIAPILSLRLLELPSFTMMFVVLSIVNFIGLAIASFIPKSQFVE